MAVNFNTDDHINKNGGALFGEDSAPLHEDQLSLRHSENTEDPLTIIIGNAVQTSIFAVAAGLGGGLVYGDC